MLRLQRIYAPGTQINCNEHYTFCPARVSGVNLQGTMEDKIKITGGITHV